MKKKRRREERKKMKGQMRRDDGGNDERQAGSACKACVGCSRRESSEKGAARAQLFCILAGKPHGILKALGPEQMQHPTLQHTNFKDVKKIFILEEDQSFVLGIFMQALQELNRDPTQRLILFMTRFRQKTEKPVSIAAIVNRKGVHSITCHAACNIKAKDPRVDLLWSRYGLQNLVSHRGNLYGAYGVTEAANFQSNLDRHPLTLDRDLTDVFSGATAYSDITFIQLYATTPHVHRDNLKHPVSRVIATCGIHIAKHTNSLLRAAKAYIDHMADLAAKNGGSLPDRGGTFLSALRHVRHVTSSDHRPSIICCKRPPCSSHSGTTVMAWD
ncbi:hypothetical protein Q8A67_012686 [Cirrhinus molitorella]|uniref:Uncharacterized protein n=1 Tax=Cirrhinus molitorella TaxID=172907 RepID=A0AA88TPA8_9TELE|nr:hypothetical protein Q8A67_012686 [Cirrhinus molitorella]